jgi:AbrB family looped-hinge helix DNA binding protein
MVEISGVGDVARTDEAEAVPSGTCSRMPYRIARSLPAEAAVHGSGPPTGLECHNAWYYPAMRITIDTSGRLVIPKALRDAAGIVPGGTVEATVRDGRIELESPPADVRVERQGHVWVALPDAPTRPLRSADVQATLDALRAER